MKAILVRPRFDEPSQHSFAFASEILQWCRQAGIDIIDLAEDDAVRPAVEKALQTFNPDIFSFTSAILSPFCSSESFYGELEERQ
ncbi:unnamed protein product [marine sediment metagenome]|uniref:B12-binding domain-containing protein n=1 Tax=marine sediment metagenome TaxID=412755 RepID=X1SQ43_9ZZZZ